MIIYSKVASSRLKYLVGFLASFYKNEVRLTTTLPGNASFYINYSDIPQSNSLQIIPHTLLFEDTIAAQEITVEKWNSIPAFFKTGKRNTLEFDVLAASFYMISRYEEYLPYKADMHNRYPAEKSLAFKNGFLDVPVVDEWLLLLVEIYNKAGGVLQVNRCYSFRPTVDIDKAYAYKNQIFPFNFLIPAKCFVSKNAAECLSVLQNKKADPYDVYHLFDEQHKKYNLHALYFILSGKRGANDRSIPVSHKSMRILLNQLNRHSTLGIHPSYASFENMETIANERDCLSKVIGEKIDKSRQHYLRFTVPNTYQILDQIGISEEYSMGFASQPGFRAGTCTPFYFYNLNTKQETSLKIFPLILMDVTLSHYLQLSRGEAIGYSNQIINKVKKVKGCFISLWHNSSFSSLNNMDGWDQVFTAMMKSAATND